jgi:MFS family permease
VLGYWGDTHGRKTVLLLCMFLMGFSTMAVGVLPTYQSVGIWAPVMLVILRLIQGFAVAGEISGASSMILEHAPFGRRGYFASFTMQGVQAGQLLAAAVFLPLAHFMPKETFNAWGWRIPFLLSVVYQGFNAVFPSLFPELFQTRVRVTGMAIGQNVGTTLSALLPAFFAAVAPPGSTNVPLKIGAITFGICAIAAIAAYTARETYRVHLNDLGDRDAVPVPKGDYNRLRATTMAGAKA